MKNNREFRQAATEKVANSFKQINHSFTEYAKNNQNFSQVGTIFSSIKQTRIIKRLKELQCLENQTI